MRRSVHIALGVLAACGHGSSTPPEPIRREAPPSVEATPAGADDLVVARVDGRPVYASCVRAQADALGLDVRAALDQCIHFELLAGAAEARGLRQDADVAEAWRREMVRALIHADLGAITGFEQLPPDYAKKVMDRYGPQIHRPEIRSSYYVRAEYPKKTRPGSEADIAARDIAIKIWEELGPRDGLLPEDLVAAGERASAGTGAKMSHNDAPFKTPAESVPGMKVAVQSYREALFQVPAVGKVTPPTRTPWGWDIILWYDVWPAVDQTATYFEAARESYFATWADELARKAGVTPEVDDQALQDAFGDGP